ncbi:dTDP-4-dehydrorhamnose reductase [Clostridium amazonitimonense]|uniref:dTDP-4-dehydrorhamnose reductase n=1 Tax=Clostridium amazonitimonense TaxID=1499689 RepID=UPI0005093F11|nr:dTDP-4-dehydrorhamnose reductase [Clostridium amazonitimonense]
MKILITGAKGQLGSQIINIINNGQSELGNIDSAYNNCEIMALDVDELDITNLDKCKTVAKELKPELIINCAAYTNVDNCEKQEDLAFKINALGARNLAIIAEELGAKLVQVSTDYVFAGNRNEPYKEYDITNPLSVYGKSKLLGENYVREFCSRYFILRTAWLYGLNGGNFVKTIMKAAKEKGELKVVNDQRGNPTYAEDLAHHILALAVTEEYGIYHCTGQGECSWYDFAKAIVEYSNIPCKVEPITSEQLDRAAKRPSYSSLDNMMLRCTIGNNMRDWKEALEQFISKVK